MEVFIIAALSNDKFIGQDSSQNSLDWTSKEDKKYFVNKTKESGLMIMGRKTFETINKSLPERKIIVLTRNTSNFPNNIEDVEVTDLSPKELIGSLKEENKYKSIAITGGAQIYSLFAKENLVDKLYITKEESVNLENGIKLFDDESLWNNFELISSEKLNDEGTVLKTYEKKK